MESVATSLEGPVKLLSPRAAVRERGKEGVRERRMLQDCPCHDLVLIWPASPRLLLPLFLRFHQAATAPGQYPFSILGLGDIVVPGLFVGLLKRIDEGERGRREGEREGGREGGRVCRVPMVGDWGCPCAGRRRVYFAGYYLASGSYRA